MPSSEHRALMMAQEDRWVAVDKARRHSSRITDSFCHEAYPSAYLPSGSSCVACTSGLRAHRLTDRESAPLTTQEHGGLSQNLRTNQRSVWRNAHHVGSLRGNSIRQSTLFPLLPQHCRVAQRGTSIAGLLLRLGTRQLAMEAVFMKQGS
jgi:hypothetical protein